MPKLYYNTAIRGLHVYRKNPVAGERVTIKEDEGWIMKYIVRSESIIAYSIALLKSKYSFFGVSDGLLQI